MDPSKWRVVIDLHGSKAERGIELDALEHWLDHFRRALRDFERGQSPRREQVRRTGRPGPVSGAVTGFRLVKFRAGSGIAEVEPVEIPDEQQLDLEEPTPPALRNLEGLLGAVEAGQLPQPVIDSLDKARRAVGEDGYFGVKPPSKENGRVPIDSKTIEHLEPPPEAQGAPETEITVSGRLHLIEVEEPERVGIRDTSGVDWACTYDAELESTVLRLVKSLVWASGEGAQTGPRTGKMHLRSIRALPKYDQSDLFTDEPVPVEDLEREQGIVRPQGLAALEDAEWADDEQDREYLAFTLDENGS